MRAWIVNRWWDLWQDRRPEPRWLYRSVPLALCAVFGHVWERSHWCDFCGTRIEEW